MDLVAHPRQPAFKVIIKFKTFCVKFVAKSCNFF